MTDNGQKQQTSKKINHIMTRLTVLHKLKGGYKLWLTIDPETNEKQFTIDDSYFPSITRYFGAQNREDIVSTIVEDVDFLFKHYKSFNCENKKKKQTFFQTFLDCIIKALDGIGNMRQTYYTHAEQLTSVMDKMISIKENIENSLIELNKQLSQ